MYCNYIWIELIFTFNQLVFVSLDDSVCVWMMACVQQLHFNFDVSIGYNFHITLLSFSEACVCMVFGIPKSSI